MGSKDVEPCGDWKGDFTYDGYFMRMHVKTVTQSYNMLDPSTWPLVRSLYATDNNTDNSWSKVLPEYLAYSQSQIADLDNRRPFQGLRSSRKKNRGMKHLFRCYPFNYDREGKMREHPHIPSDELTEWMAHDHRQNLFVTKEADTKDITVIIKDPTDDELTENVSPEAAIDGIMKMLDDTDTDTVSSSRVTQLEQELETSRGQISEANKRANEAETCSAQMHHDYKDAVKRCSKQVCYLLEDYRKTSNKLALQENVNYSSSEALSEIMRKDRMKNEDLEKSVMELEGSLGSRDSDLMRSEEEIKRLKAEVKRSNQETVAAKQQIVQIFEEMRKKKQGAGLQKKKKKAEDTPEAPRKKPKVES